MLTKQDLFNKVCESLRFFGNPFGTKEFRGWSWCNSDNPSERCAIARFIQGSNDYEITANFIKEFNISIETIYHINPLVIDITHIFDHSPKTCNTSEYLEKQLQAIAIKHKLNLLDRCLIQETKSLEVA